MHVPVRRGADAYGVFGVEVPGAAAADDQMAIPLFAQATHAFPGGDAAVRHHRGAARGSGGVGHPHQGAVFAHVADEHPGAAHEAAGVGHRSQGGQRSVGALVLGVSAPGLRPPPRGALETGVGQVVRGDGPLQAERPHGAVEEVTLDRLAVGRQGIGDAADAHRSHGFEVRARHLAQDAAFGRPAPGGALGTRTRHVRDDRADGGGAQRRGDARPSGQVGQCGPFHGPQSGLLHPDRAGAEHLRGVGVDLLEVGAPVRRRGSRADAFPGEGRGGDALGVRPGAGGGVRRQGQPAGGEFVDAPARHRPVALRDIEVPPGIGQGALAHLVADAFGAHEAEGEVPAVGAGASDEHGRTVAQCGAWRRNKIYFMALHSLPRPRIKHFQAKIHEIGTNPPPIPALGGKHGLRKKVSRVRRADAILPLRGRLAA